MIDFFFYLRKVFKNKKRKDQCIPQNRLEKYPQYPPLFNAGMIITCIRRHM